MTTFPLLLAALFLPGTALAQTDLGARDVGVFSQDQKESSALKQSQDLKESKDQNDQNDQNDPKDPKEQDAAGSLGSGKVAQHTAPKRTNDRLSGRILYDGPPPAQLIKLPKKADACGEDFEDDLISLSTPRLPGPDPAREPDRATDSDPDPNTDPAPDPDEESETAADLTEEDSAADSTTSSTPSPSSQPLYTLQNAVIWVEGETLKALDSTLPLPQIGRKSSDEKSAPVEAQEVEINQHRCRFHPRVVALKNGDTLRFRNSDRIMHTVRLERDGELYWKRAMPIPGQSLRLKVEEAGQLSAFCDAGHPWARSQIHVFSHPWFALSQKDGSYSLPALPAGRYTLVVWHESLGELRREVEIGGQNRDRQEDFVFHAWPEKKEPGSQP